MALRGGRTTHEPVDGPPPLATSSRSATLVDRAAAGAAYELVHRTELLLDEWSARPPTVLRQGGLGVRDLKATAALLHADERVAALLVETASAAGLLAQGATDDLDVAWLPTHAYDAWRAASTAERWATLVRAWWAQPAPGRLRRAGGPGLEGQRPLPRAGAVLGRRDPAPRARRARRAAARHRARPLRRAWRPWSRRWPGCARACPRPPRSWSGGPSRRPSVLGLVGLGGLSRQGAALVAGSARTPPPRWRRCCPRRSTTCCCRPT